MTSSREIYRSAEAAIKEHGKEAQAVCKALANALYDKGDEEGAMRWTRIALAVEDLKTAKPEFGEDTQ